MTNRERQVIMAAHGELGAAIVQMIDSDDKIICDHVRKAKRMLTELLDESRMANTEDGDEDTLLEACKHLLAAHEGEGPTGLYFLQAMNSARNAIAKAEERSKTGHEDSR